MRPHFQIASLFALASLAVTGCDQSAPTVTPTDPSRIIADGPALARANNKTSPQETAIRAAMENLKQSVIDGDLDELKQIWADDYIFINPQGRLVTRAERIANFSSGNTNVDVIDSEREIAVRIYGDMAIVQNLSTLHGQFNGVPTDTDLRGTFVWERRHGRWQLVTNQLTAVTP